MTLKINPCSDIFIERTALYRIVPQPKFKPILYVAKLIFVAQQEINIINKITVTHTSQRKHGNVNYRRRRRSYK
jgi:hypothetical protein